MPDAFGLPSRTQEFVDMTTTLLRAAGVAAFIALSVSGAVAQTPEEVTFKDNIRQFVMKGDDTDKVDVTVTMNAEAFVMTPKKKGAQALTIPYSTISSMTYDRRGRMRKMAYTLGKAEDHFLTIQYKPESGPGDFIEIEMGKNAAPRVLGMLEARSGKKIDRAGGGS
jgi:hypothetical protein